MTRNPSKIDEGMSRPYLIRKMIPVILGGLLAVGGSCISLQKPDRRYDVRVDEAMSIRGFPNAMYDEAHLNSHKANGTYLPFVRLVENAGLTVSVNTDAFTQSSLSGCDILIICNAKSHKSLPRDIGAFTDEECNTVNQWVKNGGSLLLIADHHPFGLANRALAHSFGVEMGGGSVKGPEIQTSTDKGQLVFSRSNSLLNDHPITNGAHTGKQIDRVITFTGQSLKGNVNAISLLTFGKGATEVSPDSIWQQDGENHIRFGKPVSVNGLSQALALEYGQGRVVMLGEAAMMSAQKLFGRKFGMNNPKNSDNKQFALNMLHWLLERPAP